MENLNYSSDNDKNDEYILEEEDEVGYDSANDDNDSGTAEVNDLDFIASYAVDVPLFEVSHHSSQKATDVATNDIQSTAIENDNDSDDDEIENDMEIEDDVDSSSSSDSDSEDEALTAGQRKSRFGGKLTSMLTEEEDEDQTVGPPRTKNEILETVLYPDNGVKVTAQDVLVNIGEVMYRIDHECVVVVQAKHTTHPLNEGSVLCSDKGVVLGRIHEVFGPITTPFYVVRWNGKPPQTAQSAGGKQTGGKGKNNNRGNNRNKNKEDITDAVPAEAPLDGPSCSAMSEAAQDAPMSEAIADSIKSAPVVEVRSVQQVNELFVPGTAVFMVQSHSSFVTPGVLIQQHGKGSDASNAHDEEPPEEELEYSDDEQEMLARQARNRAKRAGRGGEADRQQQQPRERRQTQQTSRAPSYSHNSNPNGGNGGYGSGNSQQQYMPSSAASSSSNGGGGISGSNNDNSSSQFPGATLSTGGLQHQILGGPTGMLFSPSGAYLGPAPSSSMAATVGQGASQMQMMSQPVFQNMQYPMQQQYGMPQQQQQQIQYQQQYPGQYPGQFPGQFAPPQQFNQYPQYQYQQQQQQQQTPWPGFSQQQQQQPMMMPMSQYSPQYQQQQMAPALFGAPQQQQSTSCEPQYRHQPIQLPPQQQLNSALFVLPGQNPANSGNSN